MAFPDRSRSVHSRFCPASASSGLCMLPFGCGAGSIMKIKGGTFPMKKAISATLALCLIVLAVMTAVNVHPTPTAGDRITRAVDGVCDSLSNTLMMLKYQVFGN